MKPLRIVVLVLVVVILAVLVWRFMPGVRHSAKSAYEQYGGWTEEARRDDPVGFIEYAEERLAADLDALEDTRLRLAEAKETIASELARNNDLLTAAVELAAKCRQAHRAAEAAGAYPVTLSGREYSRDELIEQVRLVLVQQSSYKEIIRSFHETTELVEEKAKALITQIASTKAALAELPAKKEIARINQLTDSTRDLLSQVNGLLSRNEELLGETPVRTVEELLAAERVTSPEEGQIEIDVKAFLEDGT